MNSMAVLLCVQNPYRHRPVLRENEWQNCGKKFDFKSLKWRIISLVQPFLSVFCYIVLSDTTKNYYQMILPLLPLIINLSTKKNLNNYCKMGNYNVQKTACQSSKKVFEKNSVWPWKCTMHLKVFENYEKCLILQDRPDIAMLSFCMYIKKVS